MTGKNFLIESASISDRGLSEKRPQNEDSFLELNKRGLFAVADGVGGAQAGDVASQMAMEILGEAFINLNKSGDAEDLMKIAIERANEAIFQMSHDLTQLSTMATTVVALHIAGNIATIGHVGDSRLYRLDAKGNLYRETQDHSVVEEEMRAGRMTAEQAANHPSRNVISRALGAEYSVEVDMKTIMIEPNTNFLICSDGITRHIDDFQIRELLMYDDTPENICQRMKEICYERGAEDNLTAVIAKVTDKVVDVAPDETIPVQDDLEESTVAVARQPIDEESPDEQLFDDEETQPLVMPPSEETPAQKAIVSNETIKHTDEIKREVKPVQAEKKIDSSNKVLPYLFMLFLGCVLGAGLIYLWTRNNKPAETPQQIQQMQSPNIEISSFENLRRSVDNDPNSFINFNANITQDAEGLYLLGRAYLLTGKYPEAKKSFEDARNKLGQVNAANRNVLINDIALGLAVADEAAAQMKFQNEISR